MKETKDKFIVIVAGEASGDQHGAHVVQALRKRFKELRISGAGGQAMRQAGAQIIVDIQDLSVMGFTAIFFKAPQILKALSRLKQLLKTDQPDLLILIDFPDFNLHLAGYAHKIGIPVLYYISPQVWAWRANRIHKIKRRVDHMAVILPFEKKIYDRHQVPATFVGHPLMDAAPPETEIHAPPLTKIQVAILPGSRECEVTRLLPEMLKAGQILQKKIPDLQFEISRAPTIHQDLIDEFLHACPLDNTHIVTEHVYNVFKRCRLAIIASGTASLEAAIYGIPTIIVYAVSAFSFWLGNLLVDVPHIGLANLIAEKRVLPELVQENATAPHIAEAAKKLLLDSDAYAKMQGDLKKVRKRLGRAGASDRVADIASRLMRCDRAI